MFGETIMNVKTQILGPVLAIFPKKRRVFSEYPRCLSKLTKLRKYTKVRKMISLHNLTIKSFAKGLREKKFSALEITQAYFEKIKLEDKRIGAYLSLNEEGAIKNAERVDVALAKGETLGDLAGIPLAVKDNILAKSLPATAGSRILENYIASYDSGVMKRLKNEGTII